MSKIGLQLYSVKEAAAQDFLGTLQKVGEMGYEGVEFAGFFDTPAHEVKQVLDDTDLICAGSHVPFDKLGEDQLPELLAYHQQIGNDLIICPYLPQRFQDSVDGYKEASQTLQAAGEIATKAGFTFGYHNHDFEFKSFNGQTGFDLLFEHTQPEHVRIELDCYWASFAGYDPIAYIHKLQNRLIALHIKDMKIENGKKRSTEIGTGELDLLAQMKTGHQYQVPWFTVEQEQFDGDPLDSADQNAQAMKQLLR